MFIEKKDRLDLIEVNSNFYKKINHNVTIQNEFKIPQMNLSWSSDW